MTTVVYIALIVLANVVTARTSPGHFGPLIVPWGTWLIGTVLVVRDVIQLQNGRNTAYAAIAVGLVISAISSALLGDPVAITLASAAAFLMSESGETEIFTRFRSSITGRILWSGATSSLADSAVFVVLGLSPLTTGFVPWAAVPATILGQYLVKMAMVSIGAMVSTRVRYRLAIV